VSKKRRVWVCKKCKNSACLASFLKGNDIKVERVGCQKICKGPVAGAKLGGQMEWFARVDRAKPMVGLLKAVDGKKAVWPKALESQRVRRRSGTKAR
jgi:hypothetical protein